MRTLVLDAKDTPRARGLVHGKTFSGDIKSLAAIRLHLAHKISGLSESRLLELAAEHIPVLRDFDGDLCDELSGIAEGACVSPSEVIVLNHYTDLRDLGRSLKSDEAEGDFDGGCTMFYDRRVGRPIFAQTWDMHASAIPYVIMLWSPDGAGGGAWVLSLTGCLGMAGLSRAGTYVGINNLTSKDARVGVAWSAIVRKILQQSNAEAAKNLVLNARLGSGHHYLMGDTSTVYGIESSGHKTKTIFDGKKDMYVHSNHCLDKEIDACSLVPDHSTTYERQKIMETLLHETPISDVNDAWKRLSSTEGYPRSICTNMTTPQNPHGTATCAGIVIDPGNQAFWAASGFTNGSTPTEFRVDQAP